MISRPSAEVASRRRSGSSATAVPPSAAGRAAVVGRAVAEAGRHGWAGLPERGLPDTALLRLVAVHRLDQPLARAPRDLVHLQADDPAPGARAAAAGVGAAHLDLAVADALAA